MKKPLYDKVLKEGGSTMTEQALRKMIAAGESTRQEFKSWVKCRDYRQRKELAVKSAVAQAKSGHQTGKKMEGVASAALNSPHDQNSCGQRSLAV